MHEHSTAPSERAVAPAHEQLADHALDAHPSLVERPVLMAPALQVAILCWRLARVKSCVRPHMMILRSTAFSDHEPR
jgi:hypothetical protein